MTSNMPDWYVLDRTKVPKCFEIKVWMIEVAFLICIIAVWLVVYGIANL